MHCRPRNQLEHRRTGNVGYPSNAERCSRLSRPVHRSRQGWKEGQASRLRSRTYLDRPHGVARLRAVVATLTGNHPQSGSSGGVIDEESVGDREGPVFPPHTPIAIIERASSSDQRMVASTLEGIVEALENSGEQRPPGMMVIGWSVLSLEGQGDVTIQDDAMTISSPAELEIRDKERVKTWLNGRRWIVREGLDAAYRSALHSFHSTPLTFHDGGEAVALTHHADKPEEGKGRGR